MLRQLFSKPSTSASIESLSRSNIVKFKQLYAKKRKEDALTLEEVRAALKNLSSQRKTRLAKILFNDIQKVFGIAPSKFDHTLLLRSLRARDAFQWIQHMPASYNVEPDHFDWSAVMMSCSQMPGKDANLPLMIEIFEAIPLPNLHHYNILIRACFDIRRPELVQHYLQDLGAKGLEEDSVTLTTLLDGYTECHMRQDADAVYKRLKERKAVDAKFWNTRMKYQGVFNGKEAARSEWRLWQKSPSVDRPDPDDFTLTYYLSLDETPLYTPEATDSAQAHHTALKLQDANSQLISVQPSRHAHAVMIKRLLQEAPNQEIGLQQAKAYYDEIIVNVPPHPAFLGLLVQAALEVGDIELAKGLYESAHDVDGGIYHTLLNLCVQKKDLLWAKELLDDMRNDDIAFGAAKTIRQLSIALIQAASTHPEAFTIYAYSHALDPLAFDIDQFHRTLQAIINLPISASVPVSSEIFLEIFRDMRSSGSIPNAETYSLLLMHYGKTHRQGALVKRVHDLIKLDNQYDPDTSVFNALIVGYNFSGEPQLALGVWNSMLANRRNARMAIDSQTVNCILDTCAWAGSYVMAKDIWRTRLADPSLEMNLKNWNTWIETLCRLNALDEAITTVTEIMSESGTCKPDQETINILCKFARKANRAGSLDTLQRILPHFTFPLLSCEEVAGSTQTSNYSPTHLNIDEQKAFGPSRVLFLSLPSVNIA